MAEFSKVMKQAKRMCSKYYLSCTGCPLADEKDECKFGGMIYEGIPQDWNLSKLPEVERIVMDWAAKNPELRYPSWHDAWRQLFPGADLIPCPRKHFGFTFACIGEDSCQTCVKRQIYPFVAEKLGIKPIGGEHDERASF